MLGAPVGAGEHDLPALPKKPWWSRVSGRHLLVMVVGILAFLTNLVVLRSQDERIFVAVAAIDLDAGETLRNQSLRFVDIDATSQLAGNFVTRDSLDGTGDLVIAAPIRAGDPILATSLLPAVAGGGLRAISIPVDRERAVGGAVQAGDSIDVISVEDGTARYVLSGVEVLAVPGSDKSALSANSYFLVVAVDDREALAVSRAMRTGSIDIVRSTGAVPPVAETE